MQIALSFNAPSPLRKAEDHQPVMQINKSVSELSKKDILSRVAEVDVVYKTLVAPEDRVKVTSSTDVVGVLRAVWDEGTIELHEEFKVILLNRANQVLGVRHLSRGGVAGTVADPKLIFQAAIKANCSSIILAHNHPSSSLNPSDADIRLTKKVKKAAELLEIELLDHIILTATDHYSFADNGDL